MITRSTHLFCCSPEVRLVCPTDVAVEEVVEMGGGPVEVIMSGDEINNENGEGSSKSGRVCVDPSVVLPVVLLTLKQSKQMIMSRDSRLP